MNLLRKKMEGQGSQTMPEIDYEPWNLPDNESISLFLRFLKQMMQGKASQACHIIPQIDVCKYEPSDLAGNPLIYLTFASLPIFSFPRYDFYACIILINCSFEVLNCCYVLGTYLT